MKQLLKTALFAATASLPVQASAEGMSLGFYVNESVEISQHHEFPSGPEVDGVTTLVRDFRNKVVRIEVTSAALEPDTAYSIWLAVFNSPHECGTPWACGLSDIANPAVRTSVFYGGGLLSDANGYGGTSMTLQPGKTNRELFANMSDLGLQDIYNAEIHVVLRSHGPIGVAGPAALQIGTANLACPVSGCANVFASIPSAN